jgi:hypothetical protein
MAFPLSFFAYLQINWNVKLVFVLKAFTYFLKTKQENLSGKVTSNQWEASVCWTTVATKICTVTIKKY